MSFAGSLDTNVVLRLLINDIPQQHQAAKALLTKSRRQLAVADIVIAELAFVLERYYKFSRTQVQEAIVGLTQLPQLNCNRTLFERALPIYVQHPALSFEDCCLSVYATLNDAEPLWTFDKKLATQTKGSQLVKA